MEVAHATKSNMHKSRVGVLPAQTSQAAIWSLLSAKTDSLRRKVTTRMRSSRLVRPSMRTRQGTSFCSGQGGQCPCNLQVEAPQDGHMRGMKTLQRALERGSQHHHMLSLAVPGHSGLRPVLAVLACLGASSRAGIQQYQQRLKSQSEVQQGL